MLSILDKMRDNEPIWFGHVMKKKIAEAVRMIIEMFVEKSKGRRRSKSGSWIQPRLV